MRHLQKFQKAIDAYLRPATFPVGIRLLKTDTDIPPGIRRPLEALGHKIAPCQGFGFARRNDVSLAMLKADMTCPLGVIVLGLAEPPQWWLEGNLNIGRYFRTKEANAKAARATPRFEVGEYVGLVTSPLKSTDFDVDLALVYCNPVQLMRLIQAASYDDGSRLETSFGSSGACADSIVQTKQSGKCQVVSPCMGDRNYGQTASDEVVFAAPVDKLEEIANGLEATHRNGISLPVRGWFDFMPVHAAYQTLTEMLGL